MKTRGLILLVILALVLASAPALQAAPDYEFYKGKTLTYIITTKPGGGYDAYGRLIGKYIQKHMPGTTVIFKNIPGAGHIVGANELFLAKPDGLTIGTFNLGLIYAQLIGQPGIKFDFAKYSWIGKANAEERVLIVDKRAPYKTIKDLMESKEPVKMASAGVGSASHQETLIVAEAMGFNLKVVPGYSGREGEMGMMRGEVVGQLGSYVSLRSFIKAEGCRILLQIGAKKHPELPDVPLGLDQKVSEKGKKLLALMAGMAEIWRPTAGPPNIPASRLEALREVYKKALTDPDLIKEAEKVGMELDPAYGAEVDKMIKEAIHQPEENIALLKKIIKID